MSLDALKQKISAVVSPDACSAEFYFLLKKEEESSIKRADIDQAALNELCRNFVEMMKSTILEREELSLLQISSADDRGNAIYHYDLPEVPTQIEQLSKILSRDDFELFNFESDDLSHLQGIIVILGHDQHQLALYKHQYPVSLLKRDSGFSLIRTRNENRLVKLKDDILRVNSKFEFFRIDNEYFILDINTLERFFGFHDAVKNVAARGIENIDQTQLVVSTEPLTANLNNISFSRKLVRAAKASPVLGVIPNSEVISFINTHPVLSGKIRLNEDGSKIQLDTRVSLNLFLQLLNDDFLQSELTKRYYASLAKDNLAAIPAV